ncbi:tRNA epoxyqueuosine(34) reductase QueG [Alkalicoccus luteus]|uniref:tRNA epoxyqueuosine(34) reductase QueG n=1 Tax=Alkalicoccus luteus TaxID=1237094 RepID=A0A969PNK8_9BACI|nr:tRNA epoxyqueuosine(34) reductase QueG [Alkalicoccus luteus]NJP36690.1 tRNA epoxyqueuosine(34) reductase QueG [Alkalicoccus luteus]
MNLKDKLTAFSKTIGVDRIGFAPADPFVTLKERLRVQQESGYASGFEYGTIEERTTPRLLLPQAKTIISIAIAYPSKMKDAPKSVKGDRRGLFCRASWGEDYHHVLRRKLAQIEAFLEQEAPGSRSRSMVDTGELSDRAVAERAGIGWSGKNCAVITPDLGSYVYLGEMITTVAIEEDMPLEDQCGTCTKCIDACPTGALVQGGQLDSQKCIAFLTQTKGMVAEQFRKKIGNRLYGCDTCQTVCPENKGVDEHRHPELEPDPEKVKPRLEPLLTMSNKEFKRIYGQMAGSWRGKKPIQRNALIALGVYKETASLPAVLDRMEHDPRPVIRATAAWAAAEICREPETMARIEAVYSVETDEEAAEEMKKVLIRSSGLSNIRGGS